MTSNSATPSPLLETFERFYRVKSSADVEGTMGFFSSGLVTYTDATLGWGLDGFEALRGLFAQYMPTWPSTARSYHTGVLAGESSALVRMVDTPELFGGELRILGAVDFVDGKIVRWVDYWDSSFFDAAAYEAMRTPAESFPRDLKESRVPSQAAPELTEAASELQRAFAAADVAAVAARLHADVLFEDMALRAQLVGRAEATRYLERVLGEAPYGRGSRLRHVVGGAAGGGFEWTAADGLVGITALELDGAGLVTRVTSVYDSRQLAAERRAALVVAAAG
ncbi:MAG: hypothetical protein R3B59_00935 [Dehalococcoidia bacterium]